MKHVIIFLISIFSVLNLKSQPSILKKEIVNNDTVVWDVNDYDKNKETVTVYIASDKISLPSVKGNDPLSSESYIMRKKPFQMSSLPSLVINEFTLGEIETLLRSKNPRPIIVLFILDTRGEVTNLKYIISQDIASEFSSGDLYRIRCALKNKFGFMKDPDYESYNYMGFGGPFGKKRILPVLEQIIKSGEKTLHEEIQH